LPVILQIRAANTLSVSTVSANGLSSDFLQSNPFIRRSATLPGDEMMLSRYRTCRMEGFTTAIYWLWMDGILNLELTPDWYHPDVRSRLADAIKKAKAMRASIAYWTVATDFVDDLLAQRLSGPDGFLCRRLSPTTDIDQLARLVERGAAVHIHCADLPTPRREPPQLVHSKILFFWMADRTAEIWVGSHNWTRRAWSVQTSSIPQSSE